MRARIGILVATVALALAACGDDDDVAPIDGGAEPDATTTSDAGETYEVVTVTCPGSAGCESDGDGVLRVGAASQPITARVDETTDVQTVDVDGDGEFDLNQDEYEDRDGVEGYQGVWMAGFGNARGARGVHDQQYARAIAIARGDTRFVIVSLDAVGYFIGEMDLVREMVSDLDVDYVFFTATHTHQARDTIGLWGPQTGVSGLDPAHMAFVRERTARAIREAVGALQPANVQYASFRLRDVTDDMARYVTDVRDPIALDDEVRLIRFLRAGTDTTIATAINFGSHPEYLGSRNTELSSDFVHWLREGVENGAVGPDGETTPGVGGLAVFWQGAVGSQIGPGVVRPAAWDGTPVDRSDRMAVTSTVGEQLAWFVLQALGPEGGSTTDDDARIGFHRRRFPVLVQNNGYHLAFILGIFDREVILYDRNRPITPSNLPSVETEIAILDIGRAQIITVPGELDPLLFVGGYDGSNTPAGVPIVDPGNPNPPRLAEAPAGPYLRDLARADAEQVHLMGLGNDYLGYFIPAFDFVLSESNPYLDEAEGDHYEETNAVGIDGWPTIEANLRELLALPGGTSR